MFFDFGSDALGFLAAVSSLAIFLKIKSKKFGSAAKNSLLLGVFTGIAVLVRIQNAVLVLLYTLFLLGAKDRKKLFYYVSGGLPFAFFQFFVNYKSNGSIFDFGYKMNKGDLGNIPMVSWEYPLRIIEYPLNYSPWLLPVLALALFLLLIGAIKITKENKSLGTVLISYILAIVGFISFLEPTFRNPRYFLPVIPPLIILAWSGTEFLYNKIISKIKKWKKKSNTAL
jgi:hypothetical protein